MSRTFDIACRDCKKAIWIGQAGNGSDTGYIYTGDGKVMAALDGFLWEHQGHSLVFCEDQALDDDYEEIWAEEDSK